MARLIASGELRRLYEKYGIWTEAQNELATLTGPLEIVTGRTNASGWSLVAPVSVAAVRRGVRDDRPLGHLDAPGDGAGALDRRSGGSTGPGRCDAVLSGYVELIRGTPLMLQLFVLFYLLQAPALGRGHRRAGDQLFRLRGGDLPRGPASDSARSDGSRPGTGHVADDGPARVIVPQAVRIVIPPVTNDFIALFKDTSVCSVITLVELTKQYSILANSTGGAIEFALAVAALYMMMSVPLSWFSRWSERRLAAGGVKGGALRMIEVVDLVKWHGPIEVLRGVSLAVSRGEVAAIIGPSGSGKSTFLRCLNGLESFQSGCVTLDGLRIDAGARSADWARLHRQVCRRVGMVFQSFNLFPHRTALENVMEGPVYVLGLKRVGGRGTGATAAGPGRAVGPAARDAPRALRRPAAAGRDRPCPGDGAPGDPL